MSKCDFVALYARLKELRLMKNLTQEELAEKIDLLTKLDLIAF